MTPQPCPHCHTLPEVDTNGLGWVTLCPECYDGSLDSPTRYEYGMGKTREDSIEDWNHWQYAENNDA